MKILSDDHARFIELQLAELCGLPYPSVRLEVTVSCGDFAGANPKVWVAAKDLQRFLAAFREIERSRKGEALLESMSPGILELRIEPTDSVGHFQLRFTLGRDEVSAWATHSQRLIGSFDLDAGCLGQFVGELQAFFSALEE